MEKEKEREREREECTVLLAHCLYVHVCNIIYMNNHIYSTLFKIQERKSDRRSREIEQRK